MLYPKEYLNSVNDINIELVNKHNIKGIILDVDNTLIDFNRKLLEGVEQWSNIMKQNNVKLCIVSNSNNEEKIKTVASKLDIPYVSFAKKPFKSGFKKAIKILELQPYNIAVVGDQIFTDVVGANICKMFSILVKPIEEKDYFVTKIKRPIEKIIVNSYLKKSNKK